MPSLAPLPDRPASVPLAALGRAWRSGACVAATLVVGLAATPGQALDDLTAMSIEELMGVQVSLAARSQQSLSETAAAVHILTQSDIHRSGATSIAELLRLVPGMEVARIDANKWAITARGFNERFANKLLVQVDGRSVYQPSFSGVYWEELDVVLADIERIEVVRGPGATLWGANAVNGIINVVTKDAADTQGNLVEASVGSEDRADLSLRHGGSWPTHGHYRGYLKYTRRDAAADSLGNEAGDQWSSLRGGGRLDWQRGDADRWHLQGELYLTDLTNQVALPQVQAPFFQPQKDDIDIVGGHLLGRWEHDAAGGGRWATQVFYTAHDREEFIAQRTQTVDVDIQRQHDHGAHQLVLGGGYRVSWDRMDGSLGLRLGVHMRTTDRFSLFVQDDIGLHADRLHLILGSKFEHNEFTGIEAQPSLRLRWSPSARQTYWGGISRALRTPSRGELDVRVILPGAALPASVLPEDVQAVFFPIEGNPDLQSETLTAYEIGARLLPSSRLLIDVVGFVHRYNDLRSLEPGNAYVDSSLGGRVTIIPARFVNKMEGTGRGVELAIDAQLTETARLSGHYGYLDIDLNDPIGTSSGIDEGNSATHQLRLQLGVDLAAAAVDAAFRYVDELPTHKVDGYAELDLRLGYALAADLDVEITLRNALSARHQEYFPTSLHSAPAEIQRGLRTGLRWRF